MAQRYLESTKPSNAIKWAGGNLGGMHEGMGWSVIEDGLGGMHEGTGWSVIEDGAECNRKCVWWGPCRLSYAVVVSQVDR